MLNVGIGISRKNGDSDGTDDDHISVPLPLFFQHLMIQKWEEAVEGGERRGRRKEDHLILFQVPEIGREPFVRKALASGCPLVLYTFTLQQERNPMRSHFSYNVQEHLIHWVKEININEKSKEVKVLLLWERTITHVFSSTQGWEFLVQLDELAKYFIQLSVDYSNPSTWFPSFFKNSTPSPYSPHFRLMARSIGVFILSQLIYPKHSTAKDGPLAVRRDPSSAVSQDVIFLKDLSILSGLRRLEIYKDFASTIQSVVDFIQDPQKTLKNTSNLMILLCSGLFRESERFFY
eukprot:TRINITY_DN3405_c0_g1_i4.p1 TRINITY_DN3405_c0_g1~~TRINITY_DN3405_c0_g1_i4.p1  ORF type:complete len:291 (+),score=68.66 TRINITY_DN3405_c0_g1_i4:1516-2388(+)